MKDEAWQKIVRFSNSVWGSWENSM